MWMIIFSLCIVGGDKNYLTCGHNKIHTDRNAATHRIYGTQLTEQPKLSYLNCSRSVTDIQKIISTAETFTYCLNCYAILFCFSRVAAASRGTSVQFIDMNRMALDPGTETTMKLARLKRSNFPLKFLER